MLPWKRISLVAAGLFVTAILAITAFEVLAGESVSSITGGTDGDGGPTITRIGGGSDTSRDDEAPSDDTATPSGEPSSEPSDQASPTDEPTEEPTESPSESTTPAPRRGPDHTGTHAARGAHRDPVAGVTSRRGPGDPSAERWWVSGGQDGLPCRSKEGSTMCTATLSGGPLSCVRPRPSGGHEFHSLHGSWVNDSHGDCGHG